MHISSHIFYILEDPCLIYNLKDLNIFQVKYIQFSI